MTGVSSMISDLGAEADRALAAGHLDEAERICRTILRTEPDSLSALFVLGAVHVRKGRFEAALPLLQRVSEEDRGSSQGPLWLSRALRKLERSAEALAEAQRAVDRDPGNPSAQHQLGLCHLEMKRFDDAAGCFRLALQRDPNASALHHGLGLALQGAERNSDAIRAFRRALELAPGSVQSLGALTQALMDESDSSGAVECARRMLELQPGKVETLLLLARALAMDNNPVEAEACLKSVTDSVPSDGRASFAIGTILQGLGRFDEARAQFRRSIDLLPAQGVAYSALAYSRRVTEADRPLIDQMKRLCEQDQLPEHDRSHLRYALGKSLEDLCDYREAMENFDEANRLSRKVKFGDRLFDRDLYGERIDSAVRSGERILSEERRQRCAGDDVPIFVVGMLRSGTTLLDQILSSHPEVGSVGEQGFWLSHRASSLKDDGTELDDGRLGRLARQYLAKMSTNAPGRRHVVDKMPDNYLELPLIHAALPGAKIVHVKRHPIDTCLSIYTTINRLRVGWAHDRGNIVFVYRNYLRLIEQWRRLLPARSMLEVRYEDLVADQESVTREIVDFCGLDWSDTCLHPEENKRTVSTPSVWQVRQPIYSTSIGRWRHYEPWLGEFRELLNES